MPSRNNGCSSTMMTRIVSIRTSQRDSRSVDRSSKRPTCKAGPFQSGGLSSSAGGKANSPFGEKEKTTRFHCIIHRKPSMNNRQDKNKVILHRRWKRHWEKELLKKGSGHPASRKRS